MLVCVSFVLVVLVGWLVGWLVCVGCVGFVDRRKKISLFSRTQPLSDPFNGCQSLVGDFKEATQNGPLLDNDWKCRVCGRLVAQHPRETHARPPGLFLLPC